MSQKVTDHTEYTQLAIYLKYNKNGIITNHEYDKT
jgi:hypothetical protein